MLGELLGLALYGVATCAKAKDKAPEENWNCLNAREKIENLNEGLSNYAESEKERRNEILAKNLKTRSEAEIKRALNKFGPTDWQYDIICQEAEKRGLS